MILVSSIISIENIEREIRIAIKTITNLDNLDNNANLLDQYLGIIPVDFIYIFDIIESKYSDKIYKILIDHSFHVMTIKNLSIAIFEAISVKE